ncbi:hypothetical protein [Microbacterium sp. SORGH_AS_0888]|uniref:hypothetical protein n=1 Tax=Microbacterium sp. SORGH_AS_0888 TaxID=3041791 RepID=UPI002789F20F|nr:hypothetical protein [Microbacterium sp. SORGH_AS_0888]MDQ1130667.1 hypothetical protein [Microbacterium sp. SORGH_AS_0888]
MSETTDSESAREARAKAQTAIFDAVTDAIAATRTSGVPLYNHAGTIRELAYAYRLAAGGTQPGSIDVRK